MVPGASVRLSGELGGVVHLAEQDTEACVYVPEFASPKQTGTCYRTRMSPSPFAPNERLALEIETPDGKLLVSASRVPGMFSFQDLTQMGGSCRLEPRTNFRFKWTPSGGSLGLPRRRAHRGPSRSVRGRGIRGAGLALPPRGVVGPARHRHRLSAPFRIARVPLERAPRPDPGASGRPSEGARAEIAFSAVDRNWTNWVRGERLHPTWPRRIPSVSGDGTGWFGTATQRRVEVLASSDGEGRPPLCGPAYAAQPAGPSRGSKDRAAGPSPEEGQ